MIGRREQLAARFRRKLRVVVPHLILIVFSLSILMPLLWVLRVSFTDKLNA